MFSLQCRTQFKALFANVASRNIVLTPSPPAPKPPKTVAEPIPAEKHPWLAKVPAPKSFLNEERILTFLSANVSAGNLVNVAQDWKHLPFSYHSLGMEMVLQTHLFSGFPRAINALTLIHNLGLAPQDDLWSDEVDDLGKWKKDGVETCKAVYQGVYPNLRKRLNFLHPVLENVILQHAYGRTLSRPGPSLRLRELCVIAVLAGQNVLPQLNSHLRGALHGGASLEEVDAMIAQVELVFGAEARIQAEETMKTLDRSRYLVSR